MDKMDKLFIEPSEILRKASKMDGEAFALERKAEQIHDTANALRAFALDNVGFIADDKGNVIDTTSIIPEVKIEKTKKGTYTVSFGDLAGLFGGNLGDMDHDKVLGLAVKELVKLIYGKAKRYAEMLERAEAEEASWLPWAEAQYEFQYIEEYGFDDSPDWREWNQVDEPQY